MKTAPVAAPGTRRTLSDPEVQKAALKQAIDDCAGNVSKVARTTGLARSHVRNLIDQYDLRDYARSLRPGNGMGRPRRRA